MNDLLSSTARRVLQLCIIALHLSWALIGSAAIFFLCIPEDVDFADQFGRVMVAVIKVI